MNIIIVGCGKIGSALAEQLCAEGHNITIVDTRRDLIEAMANKLDVMGVVGNGASHTVLIEAGVETADIVIAAAGLDELNLLCCLIARKSGRCHTIARVRNPVYMQELGIIKEELGLSMTLNPELAAAREISRVLRFPSAIEIDTFAKGRIELLKIKIQPGSMLHNFMLMDISNRLHCDVLVCAVERDGEVMIPDGSFALKERDTISIVAAPKKAAEFFRQVGVMSEQVKSTMLVGGGDISYYLAVQLIHMGVEVVIVEKEKERCEFLSDELPEATVICGDGTDQNLLEEEGFQDMESFAALTDMDEENILLSLFVKSRTDAKLITKVHRITYDDVIDGLDLGSIICPKNIVAENVIQYVRAMENSKDSNIETLYRILEDRAEAMEFTVRSESPVIGVPLADLPIRKGILICCIIHNGRVVIPKGQDIIQVGDSVIIVTTCKGINNLADILK